MRVQPRQRASKGDIQHGAACAANELPKGVSVLLPFSLQHYPVGWGQWD